MEVCTINFTPSLLLLVWYIGSLHTLYKHACVYAMLIGRQPPDLGSEGSDLEGHLQGPCIPSFRESSHSSRHKIVCEMIIMTQQVI